MPNQVPVKVAVDGATGYLGNHVVYTLRARDIAVRCIIHPGARSEDVEFLKSTGAEVVEASMEEMNPDLERALSGCDVAVHLIGSIAPKKGETLADLHGKQTATLTETAKRAGIRKIVHITALGSAGDAVSTYHKTKWLAEEIVRSSGLPYIILRPSLIVGKQVGNRDSKLVARYMHLVASRPVVPVIGGGHNKIQPIFVGDLAAAIADSTVNDQLREQTFELGGPEVVTMREFVEKLIRYQGLSKRTAAIPMAAATLVAAICEAVQNVPLVSKDQLKLSSQDNICKDNALQKVFGITPTAIDNALDSYKTAIMRNAVPAGKR